VGDFLKDLVIFFKNSEGLALHGKSNKGKIKVKNRNFPVRFYTKGERPHDRKNSRGSKLAKSFNEQADG